LINTKKINGVLCKINNITDFYIQCKEYVKNTNLIILLNNEFSEDLYGFLKENKIFAIIISQKVPIINQVKLKENEIVFFY